MLFFASSEWPSNYHQNSLFIISILTKLVHVTANYNKLCDQMDLAKGLPPIRRQIIKPEPTIIKGINGKYSIMIWNLIKILTFI